MMSTIFVFLITISVVMGFLSGRIDEVSVAALQDCGKAVTLSLELLGSMCLWSGVMRVAEKANVTQKISRLFRPLMKLLFRNISPESPTGQAISMNVTANLLGLGNAATPLGIRAMQEMKKEIGDSREASLNMITFVVLNTASIQLLPTTVATLRLQAGSSDPLCILPAVWLTSITAVCGALIVAKFPAYFRLRRRVRQKSSA